MTPEQLKALQDAGFSQAYINQLTAVSDGTARQFSTPGRFREANLRKINLALREKNPEVVKMRESFRRATRKLTKDGQGFDMFDDKKFPVHSDDFSWAKVRARMEEADSASTFPQVLRAGVQNIMNSAYQVVDTTYEDWVKVVNSTKDTELYAPIQGIGFPREVARQEVYPEVTAAGLDISLRNKKYGTMYAVEQELLDDDQTGQFREQTGLMGEYMRLLTEALCYGKLASVANMSYSVLQIPQTETKPSDEANWPWSQAFVGGGKNRPASFGLLNAANLQVAKIGLMNQVNKLGLKMSVNGRRILAGPQYVFDAAVLLNSAYFPSVPSATPGATGAAFSNNPVKGMADLSISRFIFKNDGTVDGTSKAWYLVDDSKPWFVLQMREALSVTQEAPNSGESFNRDVERYKVRSRINADSIDPRFAWQGNDGSVTS